MEFKFGKPVEYVSAENILKKVTEAEIFRHYLGFDFEISQLYKSPLRHDDVNPSFTLYVNRKGNIYFKDFGGEGGSVFKFVSMYYQVPENLYESCIMINRDMRLGLIGPESTPGTPIRYAQFSKKLTRSNFNIRIKSRSWDTADKDYWSSYGISRDTLEFYKVIPTDEVWGQRGLMLFKQVWKSTDLNPIYSYYFPKTDKLKCYRPLEPNKKYKWLTNTSLEDIQGMDQLREVKENYNSHILFITSSLKDVMVLYELGFCAIAPQGENNFIPPDIISDLSKEFKEIIVFYDNDEAGVRGSIVLTSKIGARYMNIPKGLGAKDPSDFVQKYSKHELLKLIDKKL